MIRRLEPPLVSRAIVLGETERFGNEGAFELIYEDLKALAYRRMQSERPDHTLQPSALVNEVWLRLREVEGASSWNQAQFKAVAARMLHRILVDHGRRRRTQKRGGDIGREPLEDISVSVEGSQFTVMDLHDALEKLADNSARQCQIVEMRFFAGARISEIAEELEISEDTVKREWRAARAWLNMELSRGDYRE